MNRMPQARATMVATLVNESLSYYKILYKTRKKHDFLHFTGRTGVFPFGPAPPPYFMRNFMQAVAGHMVHGGFGATTINTSRNSPATTASSSVSVSMDSGNTNSGQSTQARYYPRQLLFIYVQLIQKLFPHSIHISFISILLFEKLLLL